MTETMQRPVATAPAPSRDQPRRHLSAARREALMGWALAAPSALLVALFFLVPLGLTIVMSFFDWPTFGTPEPIGVENYTDLLQQPKFAKAVVFTVTYTLVASIAGIAVSLGLALLVRPRFHGRTVSRAALFAPVTIGFVPAGLLWLSIGNSRTGVLPQIAQFFGLMQPGGDWFAEPSSTLAIVVTMTVWKTAGLAMLVLLIGMDSIPGEVYEAARLDGANAWQTLTRVTLPLIVKPLSLVILITATSTFLAFDQFYTMTKGGPDGSTVTVVYYLYNAAFVSFDRGYAAAIAVVIVVALAAFSVIQVRLQRGKGRS
ncbi:MAG TPA: ABC transporter permease [Microbacterium sp.]|nr:ABC transporter permease [Microbacterium sp.]|tara:strand:+ start:2727 stop:3674 length:948 start_codon:yes stop_codon:yes gene_type:complete